MSDQESHRVDWGQLILAVLFFIAAFVAFNNPIVTFETFSIFFAVLIIIYGISSLINFFRLKDDPTARGFQWIELIIGIIAMVAGLYLIFNPAISTIILTYIFAVWFLFIFIRGLFRLPLIKEFNNVLFWIALVINILGIIVGILLIYNPLSAYITVTTLIAFGFLASGIASLFNAFF